LAKKNGKRNKNRKSKASKKAFNKNKHPRKANGQFKRK
jgi:hypothetical protein